MNGAILDYFMVQEKSLDDFNAEMTKTVKDGWQPLGNPIVIEIDGEIYYCQAVVEVEDGPLIT